MIQTNARRLRGYAAPFLGQLQGVERLSQDAPDGWEDHFYYQARLPEHSNSISMLFDLNNQACRIYTTRAMAGPRTPPLTTMVEHFKDTLEMIPVGSPVAHTLVWPTLVAACESGTPEHRRFFIDTLLKHHQRNGFANIPRALHHLRRIWSQSRVESWTMLLPEPRVFVV